MLSKIINHFDISTYGWFDSRTDALSSESDVKLAQEEILRHATDVWSLWIKHPTDVKIAPNQSHQINSLYGVLKDYNAIRNRILDHHHQSSESTIKAEVDRLASQFPTIYADNKHFDFDEFHVDPLLKETQERESQIGIPAEYLSTTIIREHDEFHISDALTGYGLELLERNKFALRDLNDVGMITLLGLHEESEHRPTPNSTLPTPVNSVVAACTLDIWYAMLRKDIRTHILNTWPGWSDYFKARDQIMSFPPTDVQRAIATKSKHRSPLRRFCMALAFNLNAVDPDRISYPKSFSTALALARSTWPAILLTPHKDGERIQAIRSLVLALMNHVSAEEYPPNSRSRTPQSGSGSTTNSFEPNAEPLTPNLRSRSMRGLRNTSTTITPRTTENEHTPPPEDPSTTTPPPAVFTTSKLRIPKDIYVPSEASLKDLRKPIGDRVSGSSWFVQGPPPSDHGQLQGMLDEGNLLRYAAFSDPAIFLTPPERGLGHIALCVLVDSSGSMQHPIELPTPSSITRTRLSEAIAFIGGLRDGLSKSPHISLHCFAYDSVLLNNYNDDTHPLPPEAKVPPPTSAMRSICRFRPLATDEELLCVHPAGGTPTATSILAAHNYLAAHHPDSTRIILVLTDGDPCGCTEHPFELNSNVEYRENPESVNRIISLIDTPVFAVGFGSIRANTLRDQYNPGHYFTVENPSHAVNVACDLITGVGQALAQ
jgi:hypothetical protein